MGYLKYVKQTFQKQENEKNADFKERIINFRRQPTLLRVERPTKPHRARALGYKSKQGFVIVRCKVKTGGRKRPKIRHGRKPRNFGQLKYFPQKSLRAIAELRASKKYPNMEVLNSYLATEDSTHKWFEIIFIDPSHPAIKKDKEITAKRRPKRAQRGLTSAARKSRGVKGRGKGFEKRLSRD